jgi:hypothetical protein
VHVCRNWRQIVFRSPRGLHLRLYCERGRPVSRRLDCWPALPIIVRYGGSKTVDPLTPEDEDNIVAALKQSGRVHSINLTITSSLLAKLVSIEEPFPNLEELVLLSRDSVQLTLPTTFRWGPSLRRLHSTRIALPTLPQLLSSSSDLTDLRLHEVPSIGYLSPKAFANALSAMTQLQYLSLHFRSPTSRPSRIGISPSPAEHVFLPALTNLKFRGTSEYLNSFVTRINAPRLRDIEVRLFNQLIFTISHLVRFIDQIEMQKSHRRADIQSSVDAISISFTQPGGLARFTLQISCEQLDWQLSSMVQICDQFASSGFLFGVGELLINTTQPSNGQADADSEHWPELIHSFSGAERFSLAGNLTSNILRTLRAADRETSPFPALKFLCTEGPTSCDLLAAIRSFVTLRPIEVEHTGTDFFRTKIRPNLTTQGKREGECEFCGSLECPDALERRRQSEKPTESPSPTILSQYPSFPFPPPLFNDDLSIYSEYLDNLDLPSLAGLDFSVPLLSNSDGLASNGPKGNIDNERRDANAGRRTERPMLIVNMK